MKPGNAGRAKGSRKMDVVWPSDRKINRRQCPTGTSLGAKQAEEIRDHWPWVEPSVWTRRMLTALEQGVKGG